jgi:serine phosphatase RsbU (regulator of sigma subunit)
LLCALLPLLLAACHGGGSNHHVTIRVMPESLPAGSRVHLAGNLPELGGWQAAGVSMNPAADGSWSVTLMVPAGTRLEFKFTRGTWRTEAVGADGLEQPNHVLMVRGDTTAVYRIVQWRDRARPRQVLSGERMTNKGGVIELLGRWKFRPGDDTAWAAPGLDDGAWAHVEPDVRAAEGLPAGWSDRGWFRVELEVDRSLWGYPLAFLVSQAGASEFYLDGRKIFVLGEVGAGGRPGRAYEDRNPRVVIFAPKPRQVLAVRYANADAGEFHRLGLDAGFEVTLVEANPYIAGRIIDSRSITAFQMVFTTVAAVLTLLHLFLFFFNRRDRVSLSLAVLTGCLALLSYLDFQGYFTTSRMEAVMNGRLATLPMSLIGVVGLLTAYLTTGRSPSFFFYAIAGGAIGFAVWAVVAPGRGPSQAFLVVSLLAALEWLRIAGAEFLRRKKEGGVFSVGAPAIGWLGAMLFVAGTLVQLLISYGAVRLALPIPVYYLGFLALAVALSLQLAYTTSRNARELRVQLQQVRELSARTLEQERRMREEEISRRMLEADNDRKTRELEEARTLQLAMLPRTVPRLAGLEVAVHMSTASEVGGDYYDFRIDGGDSLTVAVGDATGHGTKAGLMVTLVKSLFNTLGHSFFIPDFFAHCTEDIRKMNMEGLYMCLLLVRIRRGMVIASSAGMPPLYIWRAATREVEEVVIRGMPLGAAAGFPYRQETMKLAGGDTLLLMSDGFPELFNPRGETFDFNRVKEVLRAAGGGSPEEVIRHFLRVAEEWRETAPLADDMTFVAIRATGDA